MPDAIEAITFKAPVDVYTIDGRKVRSQVTTISDLPKGVYIVGGRKIILK